MAIVIGADAAGLRLKEVVKDFLEKENFHVVDVTAEGQDFVDVTLAVAAEVNKEEQNLGIVIDAYGAGPFMVATKIKGMVAAEVSDERSAYMTRGHNNSLWVRNLLVMNWLKTLLKDLLTVNTMVDVTKFGSTC